MKKYSILFIVLLGFMSCSDKEPKEESIEIAESETIVELTSEQMKHSGIKTGQIVERNISSQIRVNGKIEVPPQNMVSVSVPLGGFLSATKLLEGMHVRKGEIIAVMEDQQYIQLQQDYLMAKANLSAIEKEYQRQKELNESKASSDKVFEKAKADYFSQKVLLKSLYEKLKLISIRPDKLTANSISRSINVYSPIDGYVTAVKMNVGKYTNPTDVLFELVNPEDIHLALTVFEKDLDKLFIGQKISAFTNNKTDKKYACEIILIGKDVSDERAVIVHCHFDEYDKTLIPGMYMNAVVEVATHNAMVISNEGLVRFEGKQYVYQMIGENKFEMLEVSTQNSEDGFTQIAFEDGKDKKDKTFVTAGAYTLLMKMKNEEEEK